MTTKGTVEKKDGASFIQQIMEHLKGGEAGKLEKFKRDTVKFLDKQIREINDRTEGYQDKIEEKQEGYLEYLLSVDFEEISKTDNRAQYIPRYVSGSDKILDQIEDLEEKIENDKRLIERRKELKKIVSK